MIRLLVSALIALVANAVGLIVAALVLDDVQLDATSFVVAVVIFTMILAALIVWLAALVAALLLPFLGLKRYLEERRT